MRKHRVPVGWPRPDPRHHRFPLPNTVWEYDLKPTEFVLLSYLCCCHSHRHNDEKVSAETVAKAVHMTTGTVKKYLSSLVSKKLITDEFSPALQLTDDRMFFTLPNEIFLLNLPPSAFMVYAYLLLVEDRKTHTCHPSYNTIANQTGMARNTVIKRIGVLLDAKLIVMEHSRYLDKHGMKWKGNNLYTILPTQQAVDLFHQRQLSQLELDAERRRVRRRQEEYDRRHPRVSLCAPAAPNPTPRELLTYAGPLSIPTPVFRVVWPRVPALRLGWHLCPSHTLKRSVGPRVADVCKCRWPFPRSQQTGRGSTKSRAPQKRPVGAEAHPFGWGKHRVRLYAVRTRRGAAPAPLPPKGGERNSMQKKKTAIITTRMTPADKKAITQRAKAAGMTVTDYLTTCSLGKDIVRIDGLDDLLSELQAQRRNLNQLTTLANMGRLSILHPARG